MKRLLLFPDSTEIVDNSLTIAGQDLTILAEKFGTPLYLYDQATLDHAVAVYKQALAKFYPAPAMITYAGKAYLTTALAQWACSQGLWLDCTGAGEIAVACAGGVPREQILAHGVNKSIPDILSAIQHAGTVVVDNLSELVHLAARFQDSPLRFPNLWLRFQPGLAVQTHIYTQTGQSNSKFGMDGEELLNAVQYCREQALPLCGLHFHQGSQFRDPAPLRPAIELALDIASQIGFSDIWHFSPGGGWGVAYHEDDLPHPDPGEYIRVIAESVKQGCKKHGLQLPHLHIEPGRSIVARAGVALYRIGTVKRQGGRTWLLVDGGMADNPRPALYKARYSALPVNGLNRKSVEVVHIAGPYCESGDILIEDLPMPRMGQGEWIAIPMSGAYHLSMSSNYNGARRPAVLWLDDNQAQIIQRRETIDDLLKRDERLPD